MKHKDTDFVERRGAAKDAKAALLEKMKARQNDPDAEARRAERAAIAAARQEREATKREAAEAAAQENAERKRQAAERAAKEKAEQQTILDAEKATERDKLVARALEDEADRKAARDARYAARQARKE